MHRKNTSQETMAISVIRMRRQTVGNDPLDSTIGKIPHHHVLTCGFSR
jgi:hypothetical protein